MSTSATTTSAQTIKATRYGNILVKQQPFECETCQHLITALDAEVDGIYPDAAEFPYQGPGEWLRTPQDGGGTTALDTSRQANTDQTDAIWENEAPLNMVDAERKGELVFFVAFLLPHGHRNGHGSDGQVMADSLEDENGMAVGCIGIRILQWFPHHRAPTPNVSDAVSRKSETTSGSTANEKEPLTAEVKRMYVVPKQRGRQDPAYGSVSVAAVLLQHAEDFAKRYMGIRRVVLETGMRQYAAMKLYQKAGWIRRQEFGDYVGAGEDVGGLSRCWEKWL